MNKSHQMLLLTLCLFCIYFADVVTGALWDASFLSNVASLLLLLLTCVCFTLAIVGLEKREKLNSVTEKSSQNLE